MSHKPASSKDRVLKGLCIAAAFLLFAYSFLLATKSIPGLPHPGDAAHHWPWLADKPVGEDGFYMLSVADNLATTHHLVYTFNFPATGIQPLATFIFAALAVLVHACGGGKFALIRAVILFGTVTLIGFAWGIAKFSANFAKNSSKMLVFSIAFFLALFDFSLFRSFTYGLETGIYLCSILACFFCWHRIIEVNASSASPQKWLYICQFGVVGGVAGLARIDFGLLFGFLLTWLVLKKIATFWQTLTSGMIALVFVSPWLYFVHSVSGKWIPTSGRAESGIINLQQIDRINVWLLTIISHIAPWSFAYSGIWETTSIGFASCIFVIYVYARAERTRQLLCRLGEARSTFLPWIIATAGLTCIYTLFFVSTHFYPRYFTPILIVAIPLLSLALVERPIISHRPVTFLFALVAIFSGWAAITLHRGAIGNPHLLAATYIQENYSDTHVGAFQSGVISYFNPNVENLDGKLNQGALLAFKAGRMDDFVDHERINVLMDWPAYFNQFPATYIDQKWQACPTPVRVSGTVCYERKTYLPPVP